MFKFHRFLLISFIVLAVISISTNSRSAEPLKVKGFYIGMDINDALKNFERLGFKDLSIQESKYKKEDTYYSIRPGSGAQFKVQTGMNVKTVSLIVFSSGITDRLFNTDEIGAEIFQKTFADAYDIQGMQVFKDNPGADLINGWEHYNLKHGYRLRIFINKDVEIMKTGKASDFAFD